MSVRIAKADVRSATFLNWQRRRKKRRTGGAPVELTSDLTSAIPAWLTYGGGTGDIGTELTQTGRYRSFASGVARVQDRGLRIEPAVANVQPNPRMVPPGGAALSTMTPVLTFAGGGTLGASPFTTVAGSKYVTVAHTAHNQAVGNHVYYGSVSNFNGFSPPISIAASAVICEVIDANSYKIKAHVAATASGSGGGAAVTTNYARATATHALPAHYALKNSGSQISVLLTPVQPLVPNNTGAVADNVFGTGIGSRRMFEFAGKGTETLRFGAVSGFAVGDKVTYQRLIYAEPRAADTFALDGVTSLNLVIEELDSSDVLLATQTVDLAPQIAGINYRLCTATVTLGQATVAKVRAGIEVTCSGSEGCDFKLGLFEDSLSKTAWRPSVALPAVGAIATAARAADTLTGTYPGSLASRGTHEVELDISEIVNASDCLWSAGALELRAVGSTWPRDLVLTDGLNSATLSAALDPTLLTQGLYRTVAAWGGGSMTLACNGATATATYAGNAGATIKYGETAAGANKCALWVRYARVVNAQAGSLAAYSQLTHRATWSVPNVDLVVGRQLVNTPATPPGSGSGTLTNSGNGTVTVTSGSVVYDNGTTPKRINFTGTGNDITIENFDFRGWQVAWTTAQANVTLRNCIFDQTLNLTVGNPTISVGAATTGTVLIEYNDFSDGLTPNNLVNTFINSLCANIVVRKNKIVGGLADFINLTGGTVEENYYKAGVTAHNRHADFAQCNGPTTGAAAGPIVIRRNFADMRDPIGGQSGQNSFFIAAPSQGPISNPVTVEENIVLGATNQIQCRPISPTSTTLPQFWRSSSSVTVAGNLLDMSDNPIDLDLLGAHIKIDFAGSIAPSTSTHSIKLGWETGPYSNSYTGAAAVAGASISAAVPITTATLLNAMLPVFANGHSLTLNSQTITVSASDTGDTTILASAPLSTLFQKFGNLVPGMTFSIVPFDLAVNDNATLLRGTAIAA